MSAIAQIICRQGGLILPLRTPYDRQFVFEHVADYAKRYAWVQLRLRGREWTVAVATVRSRACDRCRERPDNLAYTHGRRMLCHPCARRHLV